MVHDMTATASGTAALSLVHPHLLDLLQQAGAKLDHFVQNWQAREGLDEFIQLMHHARGAFALLELPAAEDFTLEALQIVQELHFEPDADSLRRVEHLSYGCALLVRYLDFIAGKRCDLPELILPAINALRVLRQLKPLPDSHYLHLRRPVQPAPAAVAVGAARSGDNRIGDPRAVARAQALLQLGVLHVLTRSDIVPGLHLLDRTARRFGQLLPATHADTDLWLLVSRFVAGLADELPLSDNRRRLLARIERHSAARCRADAQGLPLAVENALLRDLFYEVGLSGRRDAALLALAQRHEVELRPLSASELADALAQISAPSEATYRSVMAQVREDLAALLTDLQHRQVAAPGEELDCATLAASMRRFGHTLMLVEQLSPARDLLAAADQLQTLEPAVVALCHGTVQTALNALAKTKLTLDSRLLAPRVASELASAPAYAQSIDEQRATTLHDLRHYLGETMLAVDAYLAADGQRSHIRQVPETLQRVCHGLSFLGLEPWAVSLLACQELIDHALAPTTLRSLPARALNTFADVLSAIDYGLECQLAGLQVPVNVQRVLDEAAVEIRRQLQAA